jgi:hypothetical protein
MGENMAKSICFVGTMFRFGLFLCALSPFFYSAQAAGPKGTVIHFTVPHLPNSPGMTQDGQYYCWLPDGAGPYRAVICHLHACGADGAAPSFMNDVGWTTLAKKYHAVFIAPEYCTCGDAIACRNWCYPDQGQSHLNWLAALDTLAKRTSHPEISTIPWCLWGHSGGSYWVGVVTDKYPERVCATVQKSYCTNMTNSLSYKVPVLHQDGGPRDLVTNDACFLDGRNHNALWAHGVDPGTGHDCANSRELSIPWFDMAMAMRLPDSAGGPASKMKPVDTTTEWFGDMTSHNIAPLASFTGNKNAACWFPNSRMASLWRTFCITPSGAGQVKDSTPPPTPYNLAGTYSNRSITITWDCDADLETGIKTFSVYRNSILLKTLTYTGSSGYLGAAGFQEYGFNDDPNPNPAPAMTYTDATVSDTGTYTFQVSCINFSNLEGDKSANLTLSKGNVTAAKPVAQTALPRGRRIGLAFGGNRSALDGPVALYDVRGRLLARSDLSAGGSLNTLLGKNKDKIFVVQPITSTK